MTLIHQYTINKKNFNIENITRKVVREGLWIMVLIAMVGPPAAQETFPGT